MDKQDLKGVATCRLVEELLTREGVAYKHFAPYEPLTIIGEIDDGPAIVLVVTD